MKKILLFVFCIVAISTVVNAQVAKKGPAAPAKIVAEADFIAHAGLYNNQLITIKNVSIAPRKEFRRECSSHPTGDKGIAIVFASNTSWDAVCFSILEADKTELLATAGPTKADVNLKGTSSDGFRIVSYKKL